ncbi:vacuolar sorting protein SNF7 [Trichoderma cornu-damae]|uniref:Vacuolar-sorting protein SNF7 n=1 Tax=Trichoderma cornu-damae TaxID=654480 RepID=A0A9P8TVF8_9HYPO|nr:vacuolar sorting protein SNF7 [Trichoderma cornu-damae]
MWGWFGGGAAAQKKKDSAKNAILGLRSQLDMLQKRQAHVENQIKEQDGIARKNVNTNKTVAKAALRRKKIQEGTLDKTLSQISTLEQQINAIESANINRETLAVLEKSSDAMKNIHQGLTPDKVEEIMEKIHEQNQLSDEIVTAITQNTIGEQFDDSELEAELDNMQQEQVDEQILKTGNVPVADVVHKMPSPAHAEPISSKKVAIEEDDEEAELRKLQAEMAM